MELVLEVLSFCLETTESVSQVGQLLGLLGTSLRRR